MGLRWFGSVDVPSRRHSDLPEPPPRPWPRLWVPGVVAATAALFAIAALPTGSSASDFLVLTTALTALVILFGGALVARNLRVIWWALLASETLAMAGIAVATILARSNGWAGFPNVSDLINIAAYVPAFIALGALIRRIYPGRNSEAWIDSTILTVTAAGVMALFLIAPLMASEQLDGAATAVAIMYPILDLALLSSLVWMLIGSTRRTVTLALITASFLVSLVADVIRDVGLLINPEAPTTPSLTDLRLAGLVLLAAAAWTPTAESFAQRQGDRSHARSTPRLAFLALGVLAIPGIVVFEVWQSGDQAVLLLALAAMIVIILAVWRIQLLVSAVEHQRRLTELVLDSAGDGIVGLDRDGMVLFANLAARKMLRCRESDLVGHRFHDVAHHERPDGSSFPWTECPMHSAVTSAEPGFQSDQRYIRRDGTSFPVEIVLSPLIVDGVVTGAVQSFRDVSEREEVEELKRQFVSVVSHELRTPLTSIRGSLQMLTSGILGPLNDDQQELLTMAQGNSTRLGTLIDDILDLERLDSGRMPLSPTVVNAATIAQEAVNGITGAAAAAGVPLRLDIGGQSDAMINVDPNRMVQVLTNLLGNAIKFSERGAEVVVSVKTSDSMTSFEVTDHGRGIPEDRLEHVFDRFGQVDEGDARRGSGTGLGLPIAKEIVERSGGTLSVESSLGKGSTFVVALPHVEMASIGEGHT
ncbi:MAG: PAS domain-containing protein [Actinomycetales bacterium]|nr:PAS domain-containing protein [Actinomycetales bacterium]